MHGEVEKEGKFTLSSRAKRSPGWRWKKRRPGRESCGRWEGNDNTAASKDGRQAPGVLNR